MSAARTARPLPAGDHARQLHARAVERSRLPLRATADLADQPLGGSRPVAQFLDRDRWHEAAPHLPAPCANRPAIDAAPFRSHLRPATFRMCSAFAYQCRRRFVVENAHSGFHAGPFYRPVRAAGLGTSAAAPPSWSPQTCDARSLNGGMPSRYHGPGTCRPLGESPGRLTTRLFARPPSIGGRRNSCELVRSRVVLHESSAGSHSPCPPEVR